MAKLHEIYKCAVCGNIVEVVHGGAGNLVCCDEEMKLMHENTSDGAKEKHVPVVEKVDGGVKVTVGSVLHPSEEKHYIEWIQIILEDGKDMKKFLKPGDTPEAFFPNVSGDVIAREYCNLHGLWKG